MFGLDTKSVVIGLALGYFILPRVTGPVMAQLGKLRNKSGD